MNDITSRQNPLVKRVLSLQQKRGRQKEGQFLIEGCQEITFALQSSFTIDVLLYCPIFFRQDEKEILRSLISQGIRVISCTETVFKKISYRDNPDGLLAIANSQALTFKNLVRSSKQFILIVERLEKPGNLGAILRSADAAGASAVIVVDEGVDIYNPNVIRSSVGAFFTIPLVISSNEECLHFLRREKIVVISATPEASISYTDFSCQQSCAFVVGREHEGLSSFWKKNCDYQVKIPMRGKVDSLNVSVTSALLLFEARRWFS